MTVRRLAASDLVQVVRTNHERLGLCFSELNFTGCEQSRSEMERWTERRKERETFCGRFRKRTPFLRLRAQLHRIRGRTLRLERNFTGCEHHLPPFFYK